MKWTNRGHQLDEIGAQYAQIKALYIWGAFQVAEQIIDFLSWLGVAEDFNIVFLDRNKQKVGTKFLGKPVKNITEVYDGTLDMSNSVIVIAFSADYCLIERLKPYSSFSFHWAVVHNSRHNFVQNFLTVYYLYKHGKLLSHWMNYVTTLKCNLNCKGCLNFNDYIQDPKHSTFLQFKSHIDTVFNKFDMHYSLHFSGGEPFINKELPQMLNYLSDNYQDRYYDAFVITNGTVLPSKELLYALKGGQFRVFIDDYRKTVPLACLNLSKLEKILSEYGIKFDTSIADYWFDVITDKDISFDSEELMIHRDNCNLFLQGFGDGRIYSCGYTQFGASAGIIFENENDYIDIAKATKMEMLEFRQGYTLTGYVDFCKRCRGIGEDSLKIPVAEQLSKK